MPHPSIITYMCINRGVKYNKEIEEICLKTSPLTLTAITKPPVVKGKGKMKEFKKGRRDSEQNEQAIMVSIMKTRDER